MTNRTPIRLLVADELPYSHGVENVSLALVVEFLELVEEVTWVTTRPSRARELKKRLPNAKNLNFASLFPAEPAPQTNGKPRTSLNWRGMVKRLPFIGREARKAYRKKIDGRLKQISHENRCTHCFVNYALSQTAPKVEIPVVGLIHDLNFLHYPDNFAPGAPCELRRAIVNWLKDADAVTVLSEAGKEELLGLADGTPNAHVEIIPNAIKTLKKENAWRQGKGSPIFLYPATALAHKNHLGLLQASRELALKGNDFQVIMTGSKIEEIGKKEPLANATVEKARCYYAEHEQILSKVVSFRAARDSNELSQFYRDAHRVILPTQYEGFGLPLLEALSHGIRVTCSRIPQFLEQVTRYELTDWVDFFDAENSKSIAKAMERSLLQKEEPLPFEEVEEKLIRWQWRDSALAYLNLFAKMQLNESPRAQH
jgi:glycosyltransferase involved in cell wall biosynthesis